MSLIDEALKRIKNEVNVLVVGLALAGVNTSACQEKILKICYQNYSNVAKSFTVVNDTVGSIYTATPSGTGSNCTLLTETGHQITCGGWGYILGDQGSGRMNLYFLGYFVSLKTIKTLENITNLLELFYSNFKVANIASLAKPLCDLGRDGDELVQSIFYKAGRDLALHIMAVIRKAGIESSVDIVCTGSMWKSWDLLKSGFKSGMEPTVDYRLLYLKKTAAIGAALYAAKCSSKGSLIENYDYSANFEVL
ncbi:N-acetyl-D-glucosamine kinase-like [Octopus sinensis]|uniref:N-acetyl-D-glucosamine kinase n=1 Tax=Octopus sinensis TaxID=2607531 RepID=A0A6P7TSI1_9MOLL|nr:N-acetyl-D-glucosamine kinase-like [Octopus sinensis]